MKAFIMQKLINILSFMQKNYKYVYKKEEEQIRKCGQRQAEERNGELEFYKIIRTFMP